MIVNSEDYKERATLFGEPPAYVPGEEFTKIIAEQDKTVAALVKEIGIGH